MIILYSKSMRLFIGSGFLVSYHGLRKPIHFYGLSPLGTMSDYNWQVFHPRGDLSLKHILFIMYKIVRLRLTLFHLIDPTQSNTKRSFDSLTIHSHPFNAMSPCICNVICHCLFVPCHIYDEYYMDNLIKHVYHQFILDNYIQHAYNFPTLTHSCQCIKQAHINITYKSLLSQVMKHFIL